MDRSIPFLPFFPLLFLTLFPLDYFTSLFFFTFSFILSQMGELLGYNYIMSDGLVLLLLFSSMTWLINNEINGSGSNK